MSAPPFVSPLLQRTLAAVYLFYDAFFFPIDDNSPPITSPLVVSIPSLRLTAGYSASDSTYRFSALTLTQRPPAGVNLDVEVTSIAGDYTSFEPIKLTLPRPLSSPVKRTDVLIPAPLWPTPATRPPQGETAVRGQIHSAGPLPVSGLKVEIWVGPAPTPPPGTPFTFSDNQGQFLYRFPLHKGPAGAAASFRIRLNNGAVGVSPASLSLQLGATQVIVFQRI